MFLSGYSVFAGSISFGPGYLGPAPGKPGTYHQFPGVHDADYAVLDSSRTKWPANDFTYMAKVRELLSGRYRVDFTRGPLLLLRKEDQAAPTSPPWAFAKGIWAPME